MNDVYLVGYMFESMIIFFSFQVFILISNHQTDAENNGEIFFVKLHMQFVFVFCLIV